MTRRAVFRAILTPVCGTVVVAAMAGAVIGLCWLVILLLEWIGMTQRILAIIVVCLAACLVLVVTYFIGRDIARELVP